MADANRDLDQERNAFCFAAAQGDTNGMKDYLKTRGMDDPAFPQVLISALAAAVMAEQPETTQFTLGYVESYRVFPEGFVRNFFKQSDLRADLYLNEAIDEYKAGAKALDGQRNNFCAAAAAGDMQEAQKYLKDVGTKDSHFDMVLFTAFSMAHFGQHMDVAKAIYEAADKESTLLRRMVTDMKDMLDGKKPPTLGDNFGPTGKGLNPNR